MLHLVRCIPAEVKNHQGPMGGKAAPGLPLIYTYQQACQRLLEPVVSVTIRIYEIKYNGMKFMEE